MKWRSTFAGMALIAMSSAQAALVVLTPSGGEFAPGEGFTVVVDAFDFPSTGGATLGFVFNADVVNIDSPSDFSLGSSPFTFGLFPGEFPTENAPGNWTVNLFAPLAGPDPNGDFNVFQVDFTAVSQGITTIALVDEETTVKGWFASDFTVISGVDYDVAVVRVVPLPAGVWMLLGGLGILVAARRRDAATVSTKGTGQILQCNIAEASSARGATPLAVDSCGVQHPVRAS